MYSMSSRFLQQPRKIDFRTALVTYPDCILRTTIFIFFNTLLGSPHAQGCRIFFQNPKFISFESLQASANQADKTIFAALLCGTDDS